MAVLNINLPTLALSSVLILSLLFTNTHAQDPQVISVYGNETDAQNSGGGRPLVQLLPDPTFWSTVSNASTARIFTARFVEGPCVLVRAIFNGTSVEFSGASSANFNATSTNLLEVSSSNLQYNLDGQTTGGTISSDGNLLFKASSTSYQHILAVSSKDCADPLLTGLTFDEAAFIILTPTAIVGRPLPQFVTAYDFHAQDPTLYVNNVSVVFDPPGNLTSSGLLESRSSTSNVTMSMVFFGQSILLSINPSPSNVPYPAARLFIDGVVRSDLLPTDPGSRPNAFFVSGLSPGWHAVDVRTSSPGLLTFESASIDPPTGSTDGGEFSNSSTSTTALPSLTTSKSRLPASKDRVLAASIATSIIGAVLVASFAGFYLMRWRARRRPQSHITITPFKHERRLPGSPRVYTTGSLTRDVGINSVHLKDTEMTAVQSTPLISMNLQLSSNPFEEGEVMLDAFSVHSDHAISEDATAGDSAPCFSPFALQRDHLRIYSRMEDEGAGILTKEKDEIIPDIDPQDGGPGINAAQSTPREAEIASVISGGGLTERRINAVTAFGVVSPEAQRVIQSLWGEVQILRAQQSAPDYSEGGNERELDSLPEYQSQSGEPGT